MVCPGSDYSSFGYKYSSIGTHKVAKYLHPTPKSDEDYENEPH